MNSKVKQAIENKEDIHSDDINGAPPKDYQLCLNCCEYFHHLNEFKSKHCSHCGGVPIPDLPKKIEVVEEPIRVQAVKALAKPRITKNMQKRILGSDPAREIRYESVEWAGTIYDLDDHVVAVTKDQDILSLNIFEGDAFVRLKVKKFGFDTSHKLSMVLAGKLRKGLSLEEAKKIIAPLIEK